MVTGPIAFTLAQAIHKQLANAMRLGLRRWSLTSLTRVLAVLLHYSQVRDHAAISVRIKTSFNGCKCDNEDQSNNDRRRECQHYKVGHDLGRLSYKIFPRRRSFSDEMGCSKVICGGRFS
jgi:hypothetical protein